MSTDCISCNIRRSSQFASSSSIKARSLVDHALVTRLVSVGSLKPGLTKSGGVRGTITVDSDFTAKEQMSLGPFALSKSLDSDINGVLSVSGNIVSRVSSEGSLNNKYVDKFAGPCESLKKFEDYQATEKLYPVRDIITSLNGKYFVDKTLATGNLYASIDEGIFLGDYTKPFKNSIRIADEKTSYIQPSSILTDGDFRYKFELSTPKQVAKESFLFIRASAPTSNYASRIPPQYTLSNIRLEDPSGNLIIKYKDISIRGDANYNTNYANFATYISEPEVNNLLLRTWDRNYPLMEQGSGYTLNINLNTKGLDDPFNDGYNVGYEYDCTNSGNILLLPQNKPTTLTNNFRISTIEIANSGGVGILRDAGLNFYSEVSPIGQRVSRSIFPAQVLTSDFNAGIYPSTTTVWKSYDGLEQNTQASGAILLTDILNNYSIQDYITLHSSTVADSGKLNLKFSSKPAINAIEYTNGAFRFGDKNFDAANLSNVVGDDTFFTVDSIELKVTAKKAVGSRDYVIDVVGYSDDRLLNITSAVGGFLQNTSGTGNVPVSSGFNFSSELGISNKAISDKDNYYESSVTNNAGGDHYKLVTTPVVNSTTFAEYTIPLKIYEDTVSLGKSKDYSNSSSFENLFLDICPIPSGASIASIQLVINYKPSNGLMLHTLGQESSKSLSTGSIILKPSSRRSNDNIINTGYGFAPLSSIQNIPHGYSTPYSLKTNYSRRWRGVEGSVVSSPFDPNGFDFSFYSKQLNTPFLNGYFSFNQDRSKSIISDSVDSVSPVSGIYVGNYSKVSNYGLRFNSNSLFSQSTPYTTIDFTSITGYDNHPLKGKIADAFDNAVRVSGSAGYINFGNIDTSSGFAIFTRFSPDVNMSGVGYNLWNSGIIFSKYDSGKNLEFALGYQSGKLTGYARSSTGTTITVQDSVNYYDYQYPLSVILTYNDNLSQKLKLYTDNELSSTNFNPLRAQSSVFTLYNSNSNLAVGYGQGQGVGVNAFITDIGISTYNASGTNIVSSGSTTDKLYKQISVDSFFDGLRHKFWDVSESYNNDAFKLWKYIDDTNSDWHLGAFKICAFSPDFDSFTKRVGSDYIIHSLTHSGSGYSQLTNGTLPSNVLLSGVSYHTQIENDFLRFNLSDIPDSEQDLYAVSPRITKTLPRGYQFVDRAIVVDTILQNETSQAITWADGNVGPKLIVSLYTVNQESSDYPSKVNWGLVNRHTHYLEQSGCWSKISSTFDFNDLMDVSEPWSNFDQDRNTSEFDHKYYSKDIDDMFLQYDLVYPTGSAYSSTLTIHSANVKLENAIVKATNRAEEFNLIASGAYASPTLETANLYAYGLSGTRESFNMYMSGVNWPMIASGMSLYCSGAFVETLSMPLYSATAIGTIDSSYTDGTYGSDIFGAYLNYGPILYVEGRSIPLDEQSISLYTENLVLAQTTSGNLSLFTNSTPLSEINTGNCNLYINANTFLTSRVPTGKVSLFTQVDVESPIIYNDFRLYVKCEDFTKTQIDSNFNLFVMNYLAYNQEVSEQASISWNKDYVGSNIDANDNIYATLRANDEIRGVDLICYGNCDTSHSCKEKSIFIHDKLYTAPQDCVDGGIFRASNTYTNLQTSGFNTNIGYSGHFYGIRKLTSLIPSSPYKVIITGKTGSTNYIPVPPEIENVEYDLGNGSYGVKLIGDAPYYPSGRQINDNYGKSVSVNRDLLAVGSPYHTVVDGAGYALQNAGTVFLYRRSPEPSGNSWSTNLLNHKSPWALENALVLPSSYLRDYYTETSKTLITGFDPVTERTWKLGQEGRQFGYSVGVAVNPSGKSLYENSRQVVVVGGPSASWSRTFDTVKPSSIQIGLMIFTDEFSPTIGDLSYSGIIDNIKNKDIIFKYCSSPSIAFDIKIIILEPVSSTSIRPSLDFSNPKPSFITKKRISRNQGKINDAQTQVIFSGIKQAFNEVFPYDATKLHNNIPPLLGLYVDNSRSLGRRALTPAVDQFINYYGSYSFASGLKDFYGNPASGSLVEYVPEVGAAENWIAMSNDILDYTLDTGRLVAQDQVKYLTSGVGVQFFNPNLGEFNYPPASGGAVFVFEKESGVWSLIQKIDSPNQSVGIPDRFGHAVAISDDTEVIAIGSPYINEACQIYEHKPEEKIRLYNGVESWVSRKSSIANGFGKYKNLLDQLQALKQNHSSLESSKMIYAQLDANDRYDIRNYYSIAEYENIKTFSYSDINVLGTWQFIADRFLPTSRLGYSVAVNEDGSIVAFGAPTDSLNQWDDNNVYYPTAGYNEPSNIDGINGYIEPSWKSSTNAGAIRVFDSRRYFPHNKVVEYTKFGNLEESSNPDQAQHYTYLSGIFSNYRPFAKTQFSDLEIPQDAGLAFIITPEIDALSDEISDKIINWLALGDRNLVLVGNDPIWEASGAYAVSNDIINRLLDRLNSRMRLHPARNKHEALLDGYLGRENIIPSFVPENSTATYIKPYTLKGSGAADIRMHFPNYFAGMACNSTDEYGASINSQCQLPLMDNGDLRAQWYDQCYLCPPAQNVLTYAVNWPLVFKSYVPKCCDQNTISVTRFDLSNQEPRPILAAAEYTIPKLVTYPAIPAASSLVPVYKNTYNTTDTYITTYDFDKGNEGQNIEFIWSPDSGNYTRLNTNLSVTNSAGRFYKPDQLFDRNYLLQASATSKSEVLESQSIISDRSNYCVQSNFGTSTSKVVFIAGTFTERYDILSAGDGDGNLNFYLNIVSKSEYGEAAIAQLNSWTGRSSFKDAYSQSELYAVFYNGLNDVYENIDKIENTHDVCWVANPKNLPNSDQLNDLVSWLNTGNKKLVITYDDTTAQANLITQLSAQLGLNIKPIFLNVDNKYATTYLSSAIFNLESDISLGFGKNTSISSLAINLGYNFIPMLGGNVVCYSSLPVLDTKYTTNGYWQMKSGVTKVTFPVIAGSGYKIFIDTISEDKSETEPLSIYLSNVSQNPMLPASQNIAPYYDIKDINNDTDSSYRVEQIDLGYNRTVGSSAFGSINTNTINVQTKKDASEISFYILSNSLRLNTPTSNYVPKTTRLIGISGVALPITKTVTTNTQTEVITTFDKYVYEITREAIPESSGIIPEEIKVITTDNTKYCSGAGCASMGGREIADGPIVAAQEVEVITPFSAGYARSKITVLSDSSLVQGACVLDENGRISQNSINFIRSLYPPGASIGSNAGRQFNTMTKIVSPERGSPQKLYAMSANSGINYLFGQRTQQPTQLSLTQFSDKESLYDPQYVGRPKDPWPDGAGDEDKDKIKNREINTFLTTQTTYGATTRFSGIIEGTIYEDAGYRGGMPALMQKTGYDYMNFERFIYGYPGDLFGYSVDIHKNKIIVGSPFTAFSSETIHPWAYYASGGTVSGTKIGFDGGAGSAYIFEQTFNGSGFRGTKTPWEFTHKLRPSSINIGDGNTGYPIIGDRFGQSVSIHSDVIAIGAPGHDYENLVVINSGEMNSKFFSKDFSRKTQTVYDLGTQVARNSLGTSGIVSLNNGAIFTYENKIVDWPMRKQNWTLIQKSVADGYNARSGVNSYYGQVISLDKASRTDSDYTIAIGSPYHKYAISGNHISSQPLDNAGASYVLDIMLRDQPASIPSPDSFINARLFGDTPVSGQPVINLNFKNNNDNNLMYFSSGIIYSNNEGEIFLEASGQDPATKGFIQHRPYIVAIDGQYIYGTPIKQGLRLNITGKVNNDGKMNMYTNVDDSAFVYNTIGMYTSSITGFASGVPSGLYLFTKSPNPTAISNSGLTLFASGIGRNTDTLNLRIRGK
jgi:hypothetical protein